MNILILSCGTRNKIIQYFKKTVGNNGTVIATDMCETAPALYEADKYYIVPCITELGYMDIIFDICKTEKVDGILSLIDPELSLLAKHAAKFKSINTIVIGSAYELCERSLDKYQMYMWLIKHNYKTAKTFESWDEFEKSNIKYPVFVKPSRGSASISTCKASNRETAKFLFDQREGMMIQEFMHGQEIGADVYIDMISGNVVSIFLKKKLAMRAGETDKAVSIKDERLFKLIEIFVEDAGFRGEVDIDIFDIGSEYYISEVNPRFGGGYPHAYECNVNHMTLIAENLSGKINDKHIGEYREGICMMKFNELMIKGSGEEICHEK